MGIDDKWPQNYTFTIPAGTTELYFYNFGGTPELYF